MAQIRIWGGFFRFSPALLMGAVVASCAGGGGGNSSAQVADCQALQTLAEDPTGQKLEALGQRYTPTDNEIRAAAALWAMVIVWNDPANQSEIVPPQGADRLLPKLPDLLIQSGVCQAQTTNPAYDFSSPTQGTSSEVPSGTEGTQLGQTGQALISSENDIACGESCAPSPTMFATAVTTILGSRIDAALEGTGATQKAYQIYQRLQTSFGAGDLVQQVQKLDLAESQSLIDDITGLLSGAVGLGAAITGSAALGTVAAVVGAFEIGREIGNAINLVNECTSWQSDCCGAIVAASCEFEPDPTVDAGTPGTELDCSDFYDDDQDGLTDCDDPDCATDLVCQLTNPDMPAMQSHLSASFNYSTQTYTQNGTTWDLQTDSGSVDVDYDGFVDGDYTNIGVAFNADPGVVLNWSAADVAIIFDSDVDSGDYRGGADGWVHFVFQIRDYQGPGTYSAPLLSQGDTDQIRISADLRKPEWLNNDFPIELSCNAAAVSTGSSYDATNLPMYGYDPTQQVGSVTISEDDGDVIRGTFQIDTYGSGHDYDPQRTATPVARTCQVTGEFEVYRSLQP